MAGKKTAAAQQEKEESKCNFVIKLLDHNEPIFVYDGPYSKFKKLDGKTIKKGIDLILLSLAELIRDSRLRKDDGVNLKFLTENFAKIVDEQKNTSDENDENAFENSIVGLDNPILHIHKEYDNVVEMFNKDFLDFWFVLRIVSRFKKTSEEPYSNLISFFRNCEEADVGSVDIILKTDILNFGSTPHKEVFKKNMPSMKYFQNVNPKNVCYPCTVKVNHEQYPGTVNFARENTPPGSNTLTHSVCVKLSPDYYDNIVEGWKQSFNHTHNPQKTALSCENGVATAFANLSNFTNKEHRQIFVNPFAFNFDIKNMMNIENLKYLEYYLLIWKGDLKILTDLEVLFMHGKRLLYIYNIYTTTENNPRIEFIEAYLDNLFLELKNKLKNKNDDVIFLKDEIDKSAPNQKNFVYTPFCSSFPELKDPFSTEYFLKMCCISLIQARKWKECLSEWKAQRLHKLTDEKQIRGYMHAVDLVEKHFLPSQQCSAILTANFPYFEVGKYVKFILISLVVFPIRSACMVDKEEFLKDEFEDLFDSDKEVSSPPTAVIDYGGSNIPEGASKYIDSKYVDDEYQPANKKRAFGKH